MELPSDRPLLGQILVETGAIAQEVLHQHLPHIRGKLGRYLHAHGLIHGRELAHSLAMQQQLAFVDFSETPPDPRLFCPRDLAHYLTHHYVPYQRTAKGLTVATPDPSSALQQQLTAFYGEPVQLIATGPYDLARYFASTGATASIRQAKHSLRRRYRALTAAKTLTKGQGRALAWALCIPPLLVVLAPGWGWQTVLLLCNLFYATSLAAKYYLFRHGLAAQLAYHAQETHAVTQAQQLSSAELPVYSILVPLYQETEAVMERLIGHLNALDYPKEKLDIKLICEADDADTLARLKALQPPATMHIIAVPPATPRTKPKACNVALQQIRGEFLVIYDAEDAPAPDQLKRAIALFQAEDESLACLQAPLNYYNRNENLLTQLFALEYSSLFRLSLPALERLGIPIPLGGTSNHLRVSALREVGGWDPFNVTEDADLGVRLSYFGYRTRMLPSLTLEEAPITLRAWVKQRTRWIKGYIQTWLVYMRDRNALKTRLGPLSYYGFQFFIGAPALTFLLAPVFWLVFVASLLGLSPALTYPLTQILCVASLVGGLLCSVFYAKAALAIEGWHDMRRAVIAYPFYWILHSYAAACALVELATKPHYWAKTQHGASRVLQTA